MDSESEIQFHDQNDFSDSDIQIDLYDVDLTNEPSAQEVNEQNENNNNNNNAQPNEEGVFENQNIVLNTNAFNGQFNDESVEFRLHSAIVWSFVVMIYLGIMSIVLIVCLSIDWNKSCNRNLKEWTIVQIILQIIMLIIKAICHRALSTQDITNISLMSQEQMRKISFLFFINRCGNFVFISWFIVGTILRFGRSSCSANILMQAILIQFVIQWCLLGVLVLTCCCAVGILTLIWCINPRLINPSHISGATKSQINKLKEIKYNPDDGEIHEDDANCAICLSNYEAREKIRFLPCNHHFHSNCVDQWLLKNKTCPFCKREIDEKREVNNENTSNQNNERQQMSNNDEIEIELDEISA